MSNGKEWDSEIINRSIIEGVVKYVYMLQGHEDEVLMKVKEYWELLPSYSSIKRSDRVSSMLQEVDPDELPNWKSLEELKLNESSVDSIRGGTNKHERKLLEQNWSFSKIVQGFSKSGDEKLAPFIHLAHNYGMSSHLIHKDGDGVAMVWERFTREKNRQDIVKLAHVARAISDICTFAEVRSICLFRKCDKDFDFIVKLRESYSILFAEIKSAYEEFNKTEYGVGQKMAD